MSVDNWRPIGTLEEPFVPQEVSDALMAFPGQVGHLLPPASTIPQEFTEWRGTEWNRIANQWFGSGLADGVEFYPKEGIDAERGYRHLRTILGSYEPKHEYKIAGVSYLMSLWFDEVKNWHNGKQEIL